MKGSKSKSGTSKKADAKLSVRKSASGGSKKSDKKKDPNKPKRPASAFFIFMEEFRTTYKEKHPGNKSVAVVGKAGGDKWKSMSEAEKAPYVAKAAKRKTEYTKVMAAYNKKQSEKPSKDEVDEEESDEKSQSEVHDDEDDDESGEEDDE